MRRPIIAFAAISLLAASTATAQAEHADRSLHQTSPSLAMPVDEFKKKIDFLGYDIRTVEVDDGVVKARIVDRESGVPVKAKFDPATGELLRAAPGAD
ncbi:PepSY domain-containing protein [Bradyrhizobium sp. PUT101]|uniref:PepSY domain-containing protein n=1 Tax=Bradyrhizobium sp. PUT101 TaxID=3447427 RepID=UPI003F85BDC1